MKHSIVWGTCWFNESIETLIKFYISSINSLNQLNFNVVPIIFSAKLDCSKDEIETIKREIPNVTILQNTTNIFPNKNYGVALITEKAYEKNIDYVAIVDSDWDIKENSSFVNNTVLKLIEGSYDIIIPNIQDASGRSNLLIGRTILHLFYPDYKNIILTAFPGSLISVTSKLHQIVNDENYHYDWGGEWDIISIAIRNNMNIYSFAVDVKNVRHRPNNSKMQDSFQIWRAVFMNPDIFERFNNINKYTLNLEIKSPLYKEILTKNNIYEIIELLNKDNISQTQKQILYMVVYPLAILTNKIDTVPTIDDTDNPYNKDELYQLSDLAIYCAILALKDITIDKIHEISKNSSERFMSLWDSNNQKIAINNYKEV